MKLRTLIALVLFGLLIGVHSAHADTILSDFNGTGFDFAYATWNGNVTTGSTFVTIGGSATERGGAGLELAGPRDFGGHGIALTAQLGAGNPA
jgi:hypothetical protein